MPTADRRPLVSIQNVTKRFGAFTAVNGVSLDVADGEFFALLGPSGCGKTTLLRMLAGFEAPDEGAILLAGQDIAGIPPYRRPVNMMFQSYALFPHLTVAGNIAFGLKREGMPRPEREARVAEMLRLVKLDGFETRKPGQLSGGQRQRVALARALAKRPKLLLLDEPLAALDKKLREETQFELLEIQRSLGLTFIVVTHDQKEAMTLADRVGIMGQGRLAQVGAPHAVYDRPSSRYVAEFIGDINILDCVVDSSSETDAMLTEKASGLRILYRPADSDSELEDGPGRVLSAGTPVALALRPERIAIRPAGSGDGIAAGHNRLEGVVADRAFTGEATLYRVRLTSGLMLRVSRANTGAAPLAAGSAVTLVFPPDAGVLLSA